MNILQKLRSSHSKKDIKIIASIAALSVGSALIFNQAWPLFLAALVIGVITFPLPKPFSSILTARIFIVLLTLITFIQVTSIVLWILHVHASTFVYGIATLAAVLFALLVQYKKTKSLLSSSKLQFSKVDILIITPALLLTSAFWIRVVLPKNSDDVAIVQSVTHGMDDATHLGIFGALLRTDGTLLTRPVEKTEMVNAGNASYPMGWHVTMATLASSVYSFDDKPVSHQMIAYFYAKLFSLFSVVFALSVFLFVLYGILKAHLHTIVEKLLFITIALFIPFILVLPLYFEGFFSYLPVLVYLLLFASLITNDTKKHAMSTDIIMGLLAAASALTWVLTAPILLAAFALKRRHDVKKIRNLPLSFYYGLAIGTGALLAQVRILLAANSNVVGTIVNEGGIANPNHLLLFVALITFVYLLVAKGYSSIAKTLSFVVIPAALLLLGVMAMVSLNSPVLTYYYYKLQVVLLLLLLPVVYILLTQKILETTRQQWRRQLSSLATILFILGLSIPSIVGYEYVANINNRAINNILSDQDARLILSQSLNRPFDKDNTRVISFYPNQPPRTILNSQLARQSYPSEKCDQTVFQDAYDQKAQKLAQDIRTCYKDNVKILVNTNPAGASLIKKELGVSLMKTGKVTIEIHSDPTPQVPKK